MVRIYVTDLSRSTDYDSSPISNRIQVRRTPQATATFLKIDTSGGRHSLMQASEATQFEVHCCHLNPNQLRGDPALATN